ncbi:MAG: acylphosphatase [Candidatus Aenigmatarchaeota archaeon]
MRKLYKVLFYGKVQGVGFRATCARLANRLNIFGYVKNLEDGSVEAVFDCDKNSMLEIIEKLKDIFDIENITIEEMDSNKKFSRFEIIL